jgi:hypothetical protein
MYVVADAVGDTIGDTIGDTNGELPDSSRLFCLIVLSLCCVLGFNIQYRVIYVL